MEGCEKRKEIKIQTNEKRETLKGKKEKKTQKEFTDRQQDDNTSEHRDSQRAEKYS